MFNHYYHRIFRKVVVGFGTLFNDIYIAKYDDNNEEINRRKVPIAYGPHQKFLARLNQVNSPNSGAEDIKNKLEMVLPRMSFQITNITYDPSRKTPSTNKRYRANDDTSLGYRFERSPYNVEITLSVMAKFLDDGLQIIEQILPYFSPDFTITVDQISGTDEKVDIPIQFTGITMEDNYEGNYEERRVIIFNLSFLVKTYLYGPVRTQGVILDSTVNFKDLDNTDFTFEQIQVQVDPGITSGSIGLTSGFTVTIRNFVDDGFTGATS